MDIATIKLNSSINTAIGITINAEYRPKALRDPLAPKYIVKIPKIADINGYKVKKSGATFNGNK